MGGNTLKALLEQVQHGQTDPDTAFHQLKKRPFEDIGYAKVDHHRYMRSGVPEVIYCEGKTIAQIQGIVQKLSITATSWQLGPAGKLLMGYNRSLRTAFTMKQ